MNDAQELLGGRDDRTPRDGDAIWGAFGGNSAPTGFVAGKKSARKSTIKEPLLQISGAAQAVEVEGATEFDISCHHLPVQQWVIDYGRVKALNEAFVRQMGLDEWGAETAPLSEPDIAKSAGREFARLNRKVAERVSIEPPGRIKGFRQLMANWDFTASDAAKILGFESEATIGQLYAGIGVEKVSQHTVAERLKLFLSIAVDLDGLYDDDHVVKEWLDQPKKALRGKTPRELLKEGSVENLLRVRQLVQYEANR